MRRERTDSFVRSAMERLAKEKTILDVGGGTRFGKWMQEYASLFKDCDYKTLDFDPNTGADIIGDIHALPLPDASVDAVICSSVLEHVRDPLKAMEEIRRILRPQGKLFLYVPSTYPYHSRGDAYHDFWRIFHDTLEPLLEGFTEREVRKRGGYFLALSFFVPYQHRMRSVLTPLAEALDSFFKTERRSTTAGYFVYAIRA